MDKNKIQPLFAPLMCFSCLFFAFLSLIFNLISYLSKYSKETQNLLKIWANLLVFVVCFIVASFFLMSLYKRKKDVLLNKFYFVASILYTSLFFVLNLLDMVLDGLWSLQTIIVLLVFSIIISLIRFIKIKSFALLSFLYYLSFIFEYVLIVIVIAGFGNGNKLIIHLLSFSLVYLLISISVFAIIKTKNRYKNEEQKYYRQFK